MIQQFFTQHGLVLAIGCFAIYMLFGSQIKTLWKSYSTGSITLDADTLSDLVQSYTKAGKTKELLEREQFLVCQLKDKIDDAVASKKGG